MEYMCCLWVSVFLLLCCISGWFWVCTQRRLQSLCSGSHDHRGGGSLRMNGVKNIPPCCFTASPIRIHWGIFFPLQTQPKEAQFQTCLLFLTSSSLPNLANLACWQGNLEDLKSIHPKVAKIEKHCITPNTVSFYYTLRQLSYWWLERPYCIFFSTFVWFGKSKDISSQVPSGWKR